MLKKEDSEQLTQENLLEDIRQMEMFPAEFMDFLAPLLTPFLSEIINEKNLVDAHAKAYLEAKLAKNPELNREEEEEKMRLRKKKKLMERLQPICVRVFSTMMQTELAPSLTPAIKLTDISRLREVSQKLFIQGYPENQRALVEARLADSSTAESKLLEWQAGKYEGLLKSTLVGQFLEFSQQHGVDAYIMKFILKVKDLRVELTGEKASEETTQRLEALFKNSRSHTYAALQVESQKLDKLLGGDFCFEEYDSFCSEATSNIRKALEADAPDLFVDTVEYQAKNRYFTQWSEQESDGDNDNSHQRGFFK